MTLLVRTPDGADLGRVDLAGGLLVPTGGAAAGLVKTALRKAGTAQGAYDLLNGYDNGYLLVGEPAPTTLAGTITGQIELSAASRAKAHLTAHDTASATARRDAELRDARGEWSRDGEAEELRAAPAVSPLAALRNPDGSWITGPEQNDTLTAAATGRAARGVRLHDVVLYGKTEPRPDKFGFQQRLVPMEVTALHHHFEGTGKTKGGVSRRHRYADWTLTDPETGQEREESLKDGASVKVFPREAVRAAVKAEQHGKAPAAKPAAKPPTVPGGFHWPAPAPPAPKPAPSPPFTAPIPPPLPPAALYAPFKPGIPPALPGHYGHVGTAFADTIRGKAARAAAIAEAQHGLDLQGAFIPMIAKAQVLTFSPDLEHETTMGETLPDDTILISPYIAAAVGNISRKVRGLTPAELQKHEQDPHALGYDGPWWVPSDPQYSLADTTIAHEEGHVVADDVSHAAMMSPDLWTPLAAALGADPPGTFRDALNGKPVLDVSAWVRHNLTAITKGVSQYGSSSVAELQAELWGEYTMNARPRPPAKIYGDYVTAQLRKQGNLGNPKPRTEAVEPPAAVKPVAAPAPEAPPVPAAPAGKPLTGMALWMSGEGAVPPVTDYRKAGLIQAVYYSNFFSYTNNYLRDGTLPTRSAKAEAARVKAGGMGNPGGTAITGSAFIHNDADWIKGVNLLKGLVASAPPFSRPATLYRDVTAPDQVFGPVGSMKGKVFSDPGFMSTTANHDTAERYGGEGEIDPQTGREPVSDKIILNIPAGGGGMRTQPAFSHDHAREQEFTFAPGTKWRVDDDQVVDGQRRTTVTQILPPGAKPGPKPKPVVAVPRPTESFEAGGAGHMINDETGERT